MTPFITSFDHIPGDVARAPSIRLGLRTGFVITASPSEVRISDDRFDTPKALGAIPLKGVPVPARTWDYPILKSHSAAPPVIEIIGGVMIAIHGRGIAVTRGEWGECFRLPS